MPSWLVCLVISLGIPALTGRGHSFRAWAQAPSQGDAEVVSHQAPATFTSRVNLVAVPVVIRDKQGHAIGGLRQEDFQLFDKGKVQVITKFTIQINSLAPVPVASPASTATNTSDPAAASKPELPDRYVAYMFDDIHMRTSDLLQARQAANHHLDKALDPNTRAGVFTTSGRTTQGFTNDAAKLHSAVDRIQPWTPAIDKTECLQISYYMADILINQEHSLHSWGIDKNSLLAQEVVGEAADCLHHPLDPTLPLRYAWQIAHTSLLFGMDETASGLTVLRDLITKMSALPGGRTIVMVSPGFILTSDHRPDEDRILDGAIRAGVTINVLDIRGVYSPLRNRTFSPEFGGNFGGASGVARLRVDQDEETQSGNVLAELADGTGGTLHNDNAFEEGLKELAGRPEFVYVLGFSPDNLKFDGSYHGLKVKLRDGAKLDIEARRGYWAPHRAVDPAEAEKEELKETLFSRDEIADLRMDLHAGFFKPNGANPELSVVGRLDVKGLRFRKSEERNNDTLMVVTGLFDQNGNYISGIERVVELRLRDGSLQKLENSGISVEESFSVPPGRYIVRMVVKDTEGHTTTARNTGIKIP
jgi:VWFA-related protein